MSKRLPRRITPWALRLHVQPDVGILDQAVFDEDVVGDAVAEHLDAGIVAQNAAPSQTGAGEGIVRLRVPAVLDGQMRVERRDLVHGAAVGVPLEDLVVEILDIPGGLGPAALPHAEAVEPAGPGARIARHDSFDERAVELQGDGGVLDAVADEQVALAEVGDRDQGAVVGLDRPRPIHFDGPAVDAADAP